MKVVLVKLRPYDPATASRVTILLTNMNDASATLVAGGEGEYLPLIVSGPVVARSLFNGDFSGRGEVPASELTVALDEGTAHLWASYSWGDADVTVWSGKLGDAFGAYVKRWTLRANGFERAGGRHKATIRLASPARLNRPTLYLSFAGTDDGDSGDSGEGRPEIRGTLKPWLSGSARYLRPVLIDGARQIYCYHGYGATIGATEAFEGGKSLGPPAFTWANFAAMRDAVLTTGQWGHCPSLGMVRTGGQPSFPLTIHVSGDAPGGALLTRPADIAKRLLEGPAGLAAPAIPASNVTALNASRPQGVDFYLTDQITVEELLSQLMLAMNGYWLEDESGGIILGLIPPGLSGPAPARTFDLDGRDAPVVISHSEEGASAPAYRVRVGGRKTHFVHAPNDLPASIAAVASTAGAATYTFPPSATPPVGPPQPSEGDVWPDNSTGVTLPRRYSAGGVWEAITEIGTNVSLVAIGNTDPTHVVGNSFKRTAAGNDYNFAVRNTVALANSAFVRCGAPPSGVCLISLDNDTGSTALAALNYALHVTIATGAWILYAAGVNVASGVAGAVALDTNIELRYDSASVKPMIGSVSLTTYTAGVAAGLVLYAKWHLYGIGTLRQLAAGFADSLAWDGISGPRKPADNATAGGDLIVDEMVWPTAAAFLQRWGFRPGFATGAVAARVADATSPGGFCMRFGTNSGADAYWASYAGEPIPLDDGVLYELTFYAKRSAGAGNSCYFGVEAVGADKSTIINFDGTTGYSGSGHHWLAGSGVAVPAAWTAFTGYIKGRAAAGSNTLKSDPTAPGVLHSTAAYFRPAFVVNLGSAGQVEIGLVRVRRVDGLHDINADVSYEITGPSAGSVNAKLDGTFESGIMPFTQAFGVITKFGDVTANLSYAVALKAGSALASISLVSGKAMLSVSQLDATSTFEISASLGGLVRDKHSFTLEKSRPASTTGSTGSGSGTANSSSISGSSFSTTPVALSGIITAKAGANGQVACTASLAVTNTTNGSASLTPAAVWRWRPVGGTFSDIAAAAVSPQQASVLDEGGGTYDRIPAYFACNMTRTGLTNGVDYEFQLVGWRNSGTGTAAFSGQGGSAAAAVGS